MSTSQLLSMTGFGRAVRQLGGLTIEVEARSVNHRFFDLTVKSPRIYSAYEPEIRALAASTITRGRVEIFVSRRSTDASALSINFNKELFDKLSDIYRQATGDTDLRTTFDSVVINILSRREVLDVSEESGDSSFERTVLFDALGAALGDLGAMRLKEGGSLQKDLSGRLMTLKDLREKVKTSTEKAPSVHREKLQQRIQKLAPDVAIDPMRMAAEVALICDRLDTTEELVRLESHFVQFSDALRVGKECGRRLDFIVQEMGREFNTINSKAQDSTVQHLVIDAKAEIEKIKEQVQNVE